MATVAHEAPREFVPPQPSFGDALYATLLGFVIASVVVLVPVLLAMWLGLAGRELYGPFGGDGLLDWPYRRTGPFSLVANAVVCVELLAFTALFVRGMLADRVGPVSTVPIFVVLAVTGLAPLIPHGFLDAPGVVDLLLSAWLIQLAVATTAIRPLPKRTTARVIVVLMMLLAIPATYGATHPVRTGSSYGPSSAKELTVAIRNDGFADVRITRVALDTDVSGIQASVRGPMPFILAARDGTRVRLRVQQAGCGTGGPINADAVVRYRLFGSTQIAKIPVEVPIKACARG